MGRLSDESYQQLLIALTNAPECRTRQELLAWLKDETKLIPTKNREQIICALSPMLRVQRSAKVTTQRFAQDVWNSLTENSPQLAKGVDGEVFQRRIADLLKQNSLDLASSRVSAARTDVEKLFCKVRAFTDLRPVFREDVSSPVTEMVILHNFQFGYHDGMGKHHEFYLTLDTSDLRALKEVVSEAEKRAEILTELMKPTSISMHK